MRNEEVDPKVYGNPWVDLRWDNLGLIWIIWGCKYGIMQSGAIVIIRATRHAEGASQKAEPPRKLRPPKKIETSRPDKRNMRRRPEPLFWSSSQRVRAWSDAPRAVVLCLMLVVGETIKPFLKSCENFNNAPKETIWQFVRAFYCRHYQLPVSISPEGLTLVVGNTNLVWHHKKLSASLFFHWNILKQ